MQVHLAITSILIIEIFDISSGAEPRARRFSAPRPSAARPSVSQSETAAAIPATRNVVPGPVLRASRPVARLSAARTTSACPGQASISLTLFGWEETFSFLKNLNRLV